MNLLLVLVNGFLPFINVTKNFIIYVAGVLDSPPSLLARKFIIKAHRSASDTWSNRESCDVCIIQLLGSSSSPGFKPCCSHVNFRYRACFMQGVP